MMLVVRWFCDERQVVTLYFTLLAHILVNASKTPAPERSTSPPYFLYSLVSIIASDCLVAPQSKYNYNNLCVPYSVQCLHPSRLSITHASILQLKPDDVSVIVNDPSIPNFSKVIKGNILQKQPKHPSLHILLPQHHLRPPSRFPSHLLCSNFPIIIRRKISHRLKPIIPI